MVSAEHTEHTEHPSWLAFSAETRHGCPFLVASREAVRNIYLCRRLLRVRVVWPDARTYMLQKHVSPELHRGGWLHRDICLTDHAAFQRPCSPSRTVEKLL